MNLKSFAFGTKLCPSLRSETVWAIRDNKRNKKDQTVIYCPKLTSDCRVSEAGWFKVVGQSPQSRDAGVSVSSDICCRWFSSHTTSFCIAQEMSSDTERNWNRCRFETKPVRNESSNEWKHIYYVINRLIFSEAKNLLKSITLINQWINQISVSQTGQQQQTVSSQAVLLIRVPV